MGVAFLLLASFAAGASTQRSEPVVAEAPQWMDEAADTELVELLARVDAAAEPDGGLSRLTFPTALASSDAVPVAPPFDGARPVATHIDIEGSAEPADSEPFAEGWAVVRDVTSAAQAKAIAQVLRDAEVEGVAIEERLVEGTREIRVGVVGLASKAEANALHLRLQNTAADEMDGARVTEIIR
ncbi:MAG: hypothetical protein EP330_08415 [Deltaproteobacteria bacterium]|nr:MAG: hypothetical protein EP330_08415 [Deltaproteobacteria bacterium]